MYSAPLSRAKGRVNFQPPSPNSQTARELENWRLDVDTFFSTLLEPCCRSTDSTRPAHLRPGVSVLRARSVAAKGSAPDIPVVPLAGCHYLRAPSSDHNRAALL